MKPVRSDGPVCCRECYHYEPLGKNVGECWRHAPHPTWNPKGEWDPVHYPQVAVDHRCGDFVRCVE